MSSLKGTSAFGANILPIASEGPPFNSHTWLESETPVILQKEDYHKIREPLWERDLQIHFTVVVLLTISLAMNVPFLGMASSGMGRGPIYWSTLDLLSVVYSALYLYTLGCPKYVPGRSGSIFVVLWGVLGIGWVRVLLYTIISAPDL
ncbi:hypothetical protein FRB95_007785 [Tulasnella sp. JGI-2019a]|nr:hypothetical protein FRB95_007785 [Tulasnella sp. JGI-2019a]